MASKKRGLIDCNSTNSNMTNKKAKDENKEDHNDAIDSDVVVVKPLQTLSAQAVRQYLLSRRKRIPKEEDDAIAGRREELKRQQEEIKLELDRLEQEKEENILEKIAELEDGEQKVALTHFRGMKGEPDKVCSKCQQFHKLRPASERKCSVDECSSHILCRDCESDDKWMNLYVYDDWMKKKYRIKREQEDFPSESGYVNCWICQKYFCNRDFIDHYEDCRHEAGQHCGFRPPTKEISGKKYVCVPGHCGKKIQERKNMHFCCAAEEGLCSTISCSDCMTACEEEVDDDNSDDDSSDDDDFPRKKFHCPLLCGAKRCKWCANEGLCGCKNWF